MFFRLGHIREGAKGPGIVVRLPLIDRVVSLRVEVGDIPPQAAITSDNVTIRIELLRAMARQAEAERERRAKVMAATRRAGSQPGAGGGVHGEETRP